MAVIYILCAIAGCAFGFVSYILHGNIYAAIIITMAVASILAGLTGFNHR
ncbi:MULTISPECIES: hypothetical protein [unclassified Streptomyces]|nr:MULTISPECIES: hypothetical protein [unclassified Streptomyces]MDT9693970.1 hypothetical protein [Streptomyces sp. P9(2023)]MDT9701960.1 hypothetical protein [Streptomyces sp. P17]